MRVTITIPVFNEARCLYENMSRLHGFLNARNHTDWEIVIANNGSTDQTREIASRFSQEHPKFRVVHLDQKGRGRALKEVWLKSDADILCYMDVDLSTELSAFPKLIEAVATGGYDVATGSRLLKPELTTRCLKREIASRCYNVLVRAMLRTHFSDAQCGFKAITRQVAQQLLPLIEDTGWFFDTELLVAAERKGFRIFDLPVRWIEGPDTHVKIFRTAMDDLNGLIRLRRKWPS